MATFEIGLVMAGAVSAGAYTAGVMDFIIEALDAYYEERDQPGWDGPTHDVRVPVLAGASAGGMTSAITALHAFRTGFDHLSPGKAPSSDYNKLYASWVKHIDIKPLLDTKDIKSLGKDEPVQSLLCCNVIDEIVEDAFVIKGATRSPPWIGRDDDHSLRVFFTITNLRGIPYEFKVLDAADKRYGMLNHGDFLAFKVGLGIAPADPRAPGYDGFIALDANAYTGPGWDLFGLAAKATGAFPIGLAPRPITRPKQDYLHNSRVGYVECKEGKQTYTPIEPSSEWTSSVAPYTFISVDGGVIDNEPLEIARRYLTGGPENHTPRDGVRTHRAVVLIAPFPSYLEDAVDDAAGSGEDPTDKSNLGLLAVAGNLLSTLKNQARFKPDELHLAEALDNYSRFMIAPQTEHPDNPNAARMAIACGALGGFSGFLDESFRKHDYALGRRNAQAFLKNIFTLPAKPETELFKDRFAQIHPKWRIDRANGQGPQLPIIPLVPRLQAEIVIGPEYKPQPDVIGDSLDALINARASAVVGRLVDTEMKFGDKTFGDNILGKAVGAVLGPVERMGAKRVGQDFVVKKAKAAIEDALKQVRKSFT